MAAKHWLLAVAFCVARTAAAAAPAPSAAISYVEYPEDGPLAAGRTLVTDGRARYGVDVNSVIDIRVDRDKLAQALALQMTGDTAQRVKALTARLESLQQALEIVKPQPQRLEELQRLWLANDPAFRERLRASARERQSLLLALVNARQKRLLESGVPPAVATSQLNDLKDSLLTGPQGYNWPLIEQVLREELNLAHADLQSLQPRLGAAINIVAHLIPQSGAPVAIYLPGYNEAAVGAETRVEKLRFAATPEEEALYRQYEATARAQGEAKSAGDALMQLLEAQFRQLRDQLEALTAAARDARDELASRLQRVEQWKSPEKRNQWLQSVRADLAATTQGQEVLRQWSGLETTLDEIAGDVQGLRAYADLRGAFAGKTAPEAMNQLLTRLQALQDPAQAVRLLNTSLWRERAQRLDAFVQAVEQLTPALKARVKADGPIADIVAVRSAFDKFTTALRDSASAIAAWVVNVLGAGDVAPVAASLPEPPGNRRRALADAGDLGTRINLLSIPGRRAAGDVVRVRYAFFQGDTAIAAAAWTDELQLRSFGWNSQVLASLAFYKQSGEPTWKPSAAMSWMLWRNAWPQAGESGLQRSQLRWLSGAGITVMPLSSTENGMQIGLGATLGFIDNRVLVGIGSNLNASHDRGFAFMSIRLVEFPALSGSLGGSGK